MIRHLIPAQREIPTADLEAAYQGWWYTISGCGGDLTEWIDGVTDLLEEAGVGTPVAWFQATGHEINTYAGENGDPFPADVIHLLFPPDGLDPYLLAAFRLRTIDHSGFMRDRWFTDIVDNMRRRRLHL